MSVAQAEFVKTAQCRELASDRRFRVALGGKKLQEIFNLPVFHVDECLVSPSFHGNVAVARAGHGAALDRHRRRGSAGQKGRELGQVGPIIFLGFARMVTLVLEVVQKLVNKGSTQRAPPSVYLNNDQTQFLIHSELGASLRFILLIFDKKATPLTLTLSLV